jgi:hypothetical protein
MSLNRFKPLVHVKQFRLPLHRHPAHHASQVNQETADQAR